MNTPIVDFVKNYSDSETLRAHMPGHKGKSVLGFEHLDITEIKGADSLFEADSIIRESEKNASDVFGSHTFYSTEGSSLCIRAMMYLVLLYAKENGKSELVLAARNVHKTFLSAVALLDMDVEWMYGESGSYLSCIITPEVLDKKLSSMTEKPVAFYLTSPDYLGNVADVKVLSEVCEKHDVLLLVDNAHGAYLKFMAESAHPTDLGATMCCDSAHKTLGVLTGGAYLHISDDAPSIFCEKAKVSLSLFASTSPSYLILQSLDMQNIRLSGSYREQLAEFVEKVDKLKDELMENGYTLTGDESLKISISTKDFGYLGSDFAEKLREEKIECEFCDPDFVVLMLTPDLSDDELSKLENALLGIKRREKIETKPPKLSVPKKVMSIREAVFSSSKTVKSEDSVGEVLASVTVSCPPAVPVVVCGEKIDDSALSCFEYYSINTCEIVK